MVRGMCPTSPGQTGRNTLISLTGSSSGPSSDTADRRDVADAAVPTGALQGVADAAVPTGALQGVADAVVPTGALREVWAAQGVAASWPRAAA